MKKVTNLLIISLFVIVGAISASAITAEVTIDTPEAATNYTTTAAAVTTGATFTGLNATTVEYYLSKDAGTTWTLAFTHANTSVNQLLWNLTLTSTNFSSDGNWTLNTTIFNGTDYYTASLINVQLIGTNEGNNESLEFIISYNHNIRDFEVSAISNTTTQINMAGMSMWKGYELHMYEAVDTYNNSINMDLVYENDGDTITLQILNLSRSGEFESKAVSSNKFSFTKKNRDLIQDFVMFPDYEIIVKYDIGLNESRVFLWEPNHLNAYTEQGPTLLELKTNNGVLEYSTRPY